jgi:hypothetical protein
MKRTVIADRRKKVAELTLQGVTQDDIARRLGVNQSTIGRDLEQLRVDWHESAIRDFDQAREREIQKLGFVESEAWAAWQRSQQPEQAAMLSEGKEGKRSRSSLRHQYGDPRFLDQINKCITQRCLLLGLQPSPAAREDQPHEHVSLEIRRERVLTILNQLRDRERIGQSGTGTDDSQPGGPGAGDQPGEVAGGAASDAARPGAAGGD